MNLSACRACGCSAFDLHLMVPVGYCAECVASGQAAYDVADRAGDRAAMNTALPSISESE